MPRVNNQNQISVDGNNQVRYRLVEDEVEEEDDSDADAGVDFHEQLRFRDVACTEGDAVNGTNHCNAMPCIKAIIHSPLC